LASMKSQLKMLKIPIKTLVKRSKIHDYCWFILPLSSRTTGKIIPRSFIRVLVRSPMYYASWNIPMVFPFPNNKRYLLLVIIPLGKRLIAPVRKCPKLSGVIAYIIGLCKVVPPSDVCWFINPFTIDLSTMNHSYWTYKRTNLAWTAHWDTTLYGC
jgi:hypothetical protein